MKKTILCLLLCTSYYVTHAAGDHGVSPMALERGELQGMANACGSHSQVQGGNQHIYFPQRVETIEPVGSTVAAQVRYHMRQEQIKIWIEARKYCAGALVIGAAIGSCATLLLSNCTD